MQWIDAELLGEQSKEITAKLGDLEAAAHTEAGHDFNLGSPKQLQQILFEELELPVVRKTPKGQPSTAEDVLQELASDYDLPRVIIDYRSVSKLKSTYTDKLPLQIAESTGRVHTSYHQAVAATGSTLRRSRSERSTSVSLPRQSTPAPMSPATMLTMLPPSSGRG